MTLSITASSIQCHYADCSLGCVYYSLADCRYAQCHEPYRKHKEMGKVDLPGTISCESQVFHGHVVHFENQTFDFFSKIEKMFLKNFSKLISKLRGSYYGFDYQHLEDLFHSFRIKKILMKNI
jgi:hypothetical protein